MGVAVGDFDNDGFPDMLVTCVGQNRLFRNTGKGTFVDVTRASGLGRARGFQHVGALGRFRSRRPARSVRLQLRAVVARARRVLQPGRQAEVVLHAGSVPRRDMLAVPQPRQRTFEDVTATSGIFDTSSKSLGVAMLDDDQDGWPDLFVANDTQPNKLYRNLRNGTFRDVGAGGRCRVQRRRQGSSRHGGRCRRLRRLRPAGHRDHQFRQRDDRPLPRGRSRAVSRTRAVRAGIGHASQQHASGSAASSPTSISTARWISSSPTVTSTRPCATSAATSGTRSRRSSS